MPRASHGLRRTLLLAAIAAPAAFAAFPDKPITIIVPFAAGGGVDITARLLADKLRADLGQAVVVDNKAGASGMIGAAAVAKAQPDGHTLLMASAGEVAINPHIYQGRMQYAPEKDLAAVAPVVRVPNVVVVNPSLPIKNVAELVAYAKANPGKVTYASSGVGNPQHLAGELFRRVAGVPLVHVPYKGASAQLTDVAGKMVDFTFVSLTAANPFIASGKVRPIAMTSATRTPVAPQLPAVAEYKPMASYAIENWFGLFAPAKTPPELIERLNAAVAKAMQSPDLAKRMREQGAEPAAPLTPAKYTEFVKSESARFKKIVEEGQIRAE
jgi:tripartite-type tricarboxylate transporter receptor subunit TctC